MCTGDIPEGLRMKGAGWVWYVQSGRGEVGRENVMFSI